MLVFVVIMLQIFELGSGLFWLNDVDDNLGFDYDLLLCYGAIDFGCVDPGMLILLLLLLALSVSGNVNHAS